MRGLSGIAGVESQKKKSIAEKKQLSEVDVKPLLTKTTTFTSKKKLGNITLLSAFEILQKEEQPIEYFEMDRSVEEFLGRLERKPKHSVAITLDAEQGAGKTRAFFQFAEALAKKGNTVLFVSLEEHPESSLFKSKQKQYISEKSLHNFYPIGEISGYEQLATLIGEFDVVMVDSWNKIKQMSPNVDFDRDLRKAYNGKLFFTIFQRTQDGKMRGGSQAQFDGDIILKVNKEVDFKNNYIYANKNRYQDKDLSNLFYNVYYQKTDYKTPEEVQADNEVKSKKKQKANDKK